jgi:hypothetical protein
MSRSGSEKARQCEAMDGRTADCQELASFESSAQAKHSTAVDSSQHFDYNNLQNYLLDLS